MIKAISFDFDGTIVTHRFADMFWLEGVPILYAKQNNISIEAAKNYILKEYDKIGDTKIEWYDPAYWFKKFHLHSDYNDLLTSYRPSVELYPETACVLKRLSQKIPLVISSNAKREFIDIQLNATNLTGLFSHIFSSTSDFHTVKKVTDFYGMICKKLSIQPQELVHVGDHKEFDYLSSKKLGITSYYLDRKKTNKEPFIVHDLIQFEKRVMKDLCFRHEHI